MEGAPGLSVVVVSYNTADLLQRCLNSVFRCPPPRLEVIVVDNASSDDSAARVRAGFPQVTLLANGANLGFAAAVNQGLTVSRGRHVLLLNPDCEVLGDSLLVLVRLLDEQPDVGAAGGRLYYPDGSFQHAAFRFPTLLMSFFDFFPLHTRLYESRWNGRYPRSWYDRAFDIDHPLGAFLAVRRQALDQVGAMDERFFMYCEEMDWCYRIKRAGWRICYFPGVQAIHHSGQSTGQARWRMYVQLHRSRLLFFAKHYSQAYTAAARSIVQIGRAHV